MYVNINFNNKSKFTIGSKPPHVNRINGRIVIPSQDLFSNQAQFLQNLLNKVGDIFYIRSSNRNFDHVIDKNNYQSEYVHYSTLRSLEKKGHIKILTKENNMYVIKLLRTIKLNNELAEINAHEEKEQREFDKKYPNFFKIGLKTKKTKKNPKRLILKRNGDLFDIEYDTF